MKTKHFRMLKSLIWMFIAGSFIVWVADYTNQLEERFVTIIVSVIVALIHYVYTIYLKNE